LDPLAELEARLRQRGARYRRGPDVLIVEPHDGEGFEVALSGRDGEWVVGFGPDGCHEHFHDPAKALEYALFGLSDGCRLRTTSRFGLLRKVVVEARAAEGWRVVTEVGTLGFSSLHWRRTITRRNSLFAGESGKRV
jgi:hypothetical protein